MLEEYKAKTLTLMLSSLFKFNADSFVFTELLIEAEDSKLNKHSMPILKIDEDVNSSGFLFNPAWFKDDEKVLAIVDYNDGFIIINKSKIKAYLVAFKSEIKRVSKGVCLLSNKFLPDDNSYWVVKKRGMTDEEKSRYKRKHQKGD